MAEAPPQLEPDPHAEGRDDRKSADRFGLNGRHRVGVMDQVVLHVQGVVAVEEVDHFDIPGPTARRTTRLVSDTQVDTGVVVQAFLEQCVEASPVDGVVQPAVLVAGGHESAAAMYGRSKLEVSPLKAEVEDDRKLLMEFGAGKKEAVPRGVLPRIENLVRAVAAQASTNPETLEERRPVLEYLAARVPKAYLQLSDLALEMGDSERAKHYLRNYLGASAIKCCYAVFEC